MTPLFVRLYGDEGRPTLKKIQGFAAQTRPTYAATPHKANQAGPKRHEKRQHVFANGNFQGPFSRVCESVCQCSASAHDHHIDKDRRL